ncbi:MAG: hypothetical protein JWP91_2537 [Fibrobacteres bacterium]|nr:hypothetical protein [Fibrobacterota bacterium]
MFENPPRFLSGFALVCILAACTHESTGVDAVVPPTEADLIGTWRTSASLGSATISAAMDIKSDHSIVLSQKMKGAVAANPEIEFEQARESGSWSYQPAGPVLKTLKVDCQYADIDTHELAAAPCKAPIGKDIMVNINGRTWTVVDGSATYLFEKD